LFWTESLLTPPLTWQLLVRPCALRTELVNVNFMVIYNTLCTANIELCNV
jgi:hypothetical protein